VSADGTARVYLDGKLRATANGPIASLGADRLLWLGWKPRPAPADAFMRGALSDVRIYPRSLNAKEADAVARGL
jgi:hypothetical protein